MTITAPRRLALAGLGFALAVLAGCAAGPLKAPNAAYPAPPARLPSDRDGPEVRPPPDLERVPDATPQVEPIREGGPNKPYDMFGRLYVPITRDAPFTERGMASWYGRAFHGKRTASGEVYNMYAMTAAHRTLPIPSYVRVRNPANGREVIVRVNDRGPYHGGRIVDLSYTAALKLDLLRGVGKVELQRITFDDIRTGQWRREGAGDTVAAAAPSAPASPLAPEPPRLAAAAPSAAASVPRPVETSPPPSPTPSPPLLASALAPVPATAASAPADAASAAPAAVADAPPARAYTAAARGFWVQLGAFRQREGAEGFQQRVEAEFDWLAPLLAVFSDSALFRLQAGPFVSRDEARAAAERIRAGLKLVPLVLERR